MRRKENKSHTEVQRVLRGFVGQVSPPFLTWLFPWTGVLMLSRPTLRTLTIKKVSVAGPTGVLQDKDSFLHSSTQQRPALTTTYVLDVTARSQDAEPR